VTASLTLRGPVLVSSQENYLRLLLTPRHFESSNRFGPATLPKEKAGIKISE